MDCLTCGRPHSKVKGVTVRLLRWLIQWVRWNLEGRPVYRYNEKFDMKFMLDRIKP